MVALVIAFVAPSFVCCLCSISFGPSPCTDVASDTIFGVRSIDIEFSCRYFGSVLAQGGT